jgi:hypothetical protein
MNYPPSLEFPTPLVRISEKGWGSSQGMVGNDYASWIGKGDEANGCGSQYSGEYWLSFFLLW